MEGRGVVNYSVDKPSYAFSTSTTEFDDELLRRNIIDREQAMVAKGASVQEAQRLVELKKQQEQSNQTNLEIKTSHCSDDDDDDDDSFNDDDDDDFLKQYREMRLSQFKQESQQKQKVPTFGHVTWISRPEWTQQVNEASHKSWVICVLSHGTLTSVVEDSCQQLASKFPIAKFVMIASQSAIPNWPDTKLPTLFCYKNGKLQFEWIQIASHSQTPNGVEWQLSQWNVLKSDLQFDPKPKQEEHAARYQGTGMFGGTMTSLATREDEESDCDFE